VEPIPYGVNIDQDLFFFFMVVMTSVRVEFKGVV
jgi:hypothetical protein